MADKTCNPSILTQALGITATGPRTVIVPADPIIWDEGTSYEYLTLVASADFGQGYVAKKDVPSGTPLTNTEYWVPVASFNAQVAQLQTQYNELSTSLANETEARESADTSINSKLDTVNGQLENLNEISDGYVMVFGDSWSYGSDSWVGKLTAKGFNMLNFAVSGSGFSISNNMSSQIETAKRNAHSANARLAIAFGGVNDFRNGVDMSSMSSAVNSFISAFKTAFPNVNLVVVLTNVGIMTTMDTIPTDGAKPESYAGYMPWLTEVSNNVRYTSGVSLVTDACFWLMSLLNGDWANLYTSDLLHPNDLGHTVIASKMSEIIAGGYNPIQLYSTITKTIGEWNVTYTTSFRSGHVDVSGMLKTDTPQSLNKGQQYVFELTRFPYRSGISPVIGTAAPFNKNDDQYKCYFDFPSANLILVPEDSQTNVTEVYFSFSGTSF